MYDIITDPVELISGSKSKTSPAYMEAAKSIDSDTSKSLGSIKSFITSIEGIASSKKINQSQITSTRGNISQIAGYDNIEKAIKFLQANLSGMPVIKSLVDIHECLRKYQAEYSDGYSKQVRLIILEYEVAADLLVTGLTFTMANNIDVKQTGTKIIVTRKKSNDAGVINRTINDMAKQLKKSDHQKYLKVLIDSKSLRADAPEKEPAKESEAKTESYNYFVEAGVADTVGVVINLIRNGKRLFQNLGYSLGALKRSMFGILPLIRSGIYLHYKRKANTIIALEQQVQFIEMNIQQLQTIKTMDEKQKAEIIKKQQAKIEEFKKRAEKIRVGLVDAEQQTATALKEDNPNLKKDDKGSDDLVLETFNFDLLESGDTFFEGKYLLQGVNLANMDSDEAAEKILKNFLSKNPTVKGMKQPEDDEPSSAKNQQMTKHMAAKKDAVNYLKSLEGYDDKPVTRKDVDGKEYQSVDSATPAFKKAAKLIQDSKSGDYGTGGG